MPRRRYRYSKLRWRVLVHALDAAGFAAARAWRWFRPALAIRDPKRILVVQLDHLGDAVLSSTLFPQLKAAYPEARIDVLASSGNVEVFELDPHVDRVQVASRSWFERSPRRWSLLPAIWEIGRSLKRENYDLGIDVRGDVATVLTMALAGIPRRLGWSMGGGGFLLTDIVPWDPDRHEVESRHALLERLGITIDEHPRVVAYPSDDDRLRVAEWLDREIEARQRVAASARRAALASASPALGLGRGHGWIETPDPDGDDPISAVSASDSDAGSPESEFDHPPLLTVHLGAGTAAKRWPARHWHWVIRRFLDDGWRVAIVGGPTDTELSRGLPDHPCLHDWAGRLRLAETAAILERADLFLGADSGPAHLAACAGIPSVILFSGTNRVSQWRPWSRRSLVLRHRVPCNPCHRKVCPLADHPCMTHLAPERVYNAARRWWASQRGAWIGKNGE